MDEIILTVGDNNSEVYVDVGDRIKIILHEASTTGYTWDIDGEIPQTLDMVLNDYKITHKKAMGGEGKRVIEFIAEKQGEATINLKYWQEWNGDDSIEDRFSVQLIIE